MKKPLYCPRCAQPMRVFSHQGVTLEVCTACGGGLLSPGGLSALLTERSDPSTWMEAGIASDIGPSMLVCPLHQAPAPMRLFRLRHAQVDVEVDLCTACGSIWLDAGEGAQLEALADAVHRTQRAVITTTSLEEQQAADALLIARLSGERRTPWFATLGMFALFVLLTIHRYLVPPEVYASIWAFVPAELGRGEHIHTLVTSAFAHAHLLHLCMNALYFLALGKRIEQYLGARFVVGLFLCSAVVGNLAYFVVAPGSAVGSVGASGGVAGFLGALLVLAPRIEIARAGQQRLQLSIGLGAWLVWELIMALGGPAGVNHVAHIGGFLGGLAFAGVLVALDLPKVVEIDATPAEPSGLRRVGSRIGDLITEHPMISIPVIGVCYMAFTALVVAMSIGH